MRPGIEIERRVRDKMRCRLFKVESSHKLDHQKRDFVITKNNASSLQFPVDVQFTTRFLDLAKFHGFIKRQPFHPRRKRLYVRMFHPKGGAIDAVALARIELVAQEIEKTVLLIQKREEGIFILSVDEANSAQLLSLQELVKKLEADKRATLVAHEPPVEAVVVVSTDMRSAPPALPLGVIGKISLPTPESRGLQAGTIVAIGRKGVTIADEAGKRYRARYENFNTKRAVDFALTLKKHQAQGGVIGFFKSRTLRVWFKAVDKEDQPSCATLVERN